MKCKYFTAVWLTACCAVIWLGGCQNQAKSDAEPAMLSAESEKPDSIAGKPKITFSKLIQDFGEVPPSRLNKGEIKFTNTGDGTLKITKVSRCCGVVTKLAGDKDTYAPGESGAVEIEWTSSSQPMTFTRQFVVHSNDEESPASTLKIQAEVVLRVTWEPKRLRLFLDGSSAESEKFTIKSLDNRPFSVTSFKSTGDCITADFDPSVEATEFVLDPKVDTEKLNKNLKGRITIGLTHPDGNTAIILFDVLPEFTINPPLLIVFNAEPGEPIVRKLSVLNNYKKNFQVDSLSSQTGDVGIKVLSKRELTYGYQLEVELTPPPAEGKMKFLDELLLTLDNGEKLPIRCNGYYKKDKPVSAAK